jgi:hypothetical protein
VSVKEALVRWATLHQLRRTLLRFSRRHGMELSRAGSDPFTQLTAAAHLALEASVDCERTRAAGSGTLRPCEIEL